MQKFDSVTYSARVVNFERDFFSVSDYIVYTKLRENTRPTTILGTDFTSFGKLIQNFRRTESRTFHALYSLGIT